MRSADMMVPAYNKTRSVHSGRLERWLGADRIDQLSRAMTDGGGPGQRWHGPAINLSDVPGSVWIGPDGDFIGDFSRGFFESAADSLAGHLRNLWKAAGKPIYIREFQHSPSFGVGFASVSDIVLRASSGFSQLPGGNIVKNGPTGVANVTSTLWRVGAQPAAGSAGAAAPGGTVHTKADTGAMPYTNPSSGTLHLTGADFSSSVINNTLLLYDRLFSVAKTINSTATEAVTGVPTRYANTTTTAMDYIGGNFLMIEVGATALAATAHNWTVCLYTDDAGNASQTLPSVTGNASAISDRLDQPANTWFCPLATGDTGIKALSQMQCSALVATGSINFVIGHPIGFMCFPIVSAMLPFDWITNRSVTPRIFDNACLALLEITKPTTTATVYNGLVYATGAA